MNKKSFKPPVTMEVRKKRILHYTQNCSQLQTIIKSPSYAKSPDNVAISPQECAQTGPRTEKPKNKGEEENYNDSAPHTIISDESARNAALSTSNKIQPKTYRAALQGLRNKLQESRSNSFGGSSDHSLIELSDPASELSLTPEGLTKRERLQRLQDRRGTGLWVKCDKSECEKWRWLDIDDPVDIPKVWTCNLNPDKAFASCSVPEKPFSPHLKDDIIHNCFTAGSIVWAKMRGCPWWPAMVDDCPDCEQYYWVDSENDVVPSWYHVVFFNDKEISRRWIQVDDLLSFKQRPELAKLIKMKPGQRKIFEISIKKAKEALKLSIKERLQRYSFLALWKGEIPEDSDSSSSDESDSPLNTQDEFNRYIKKKIYRRRKKLDLNKSITKNNKPKTTRQPKRKTVSQRKDEQYLAKTLPESLSNPNIDREVAVTFYQHCYDLFTQEKDVSTFFNNMFKDVPKKSSTSTKRKSTATEEDSSSDDSDLDETFSPGKSSLKRKYRKEYTKTTESKVPNSLKTGEFDKENITPEQRLVDDKPKKKLMSKSEKTANEKRLLSEKNSTDANYKNSIPKNDKNSSSASKNRSNQTDSVSSESLVPRENKKPKKTFLTPAEVDEMVAILKTRFTGSGLSNLGPLSESEESE